jgi:hypothetical protein
MPKREQSGAVGVGIGDKTDVDDCGAVAENGERSLPSLIYTLCAAVTLRETKPSGDVEVLSSARHFPSAVRGAASSSEAGRSTITSRAGPINRVSATMWVILVAIVPL